MSGGSPTSTSTSQQSSTFTPNPAAMPGYGFIAGNTENLMQNPVPYFPGQTYVGPSDYSQQGVAGLAQQGNLQGQGAQMMTQGAPFMQAGGGMQAAGSLMGVGQLGNMQNAANTAQGNYNFLSGAADVAKNPYVNAMMDVNRQRMMEALPGLNANAISVNQMGSSRLGLAQGAAMGRMADANTALMGQAYGQGLGAQQNALGQLGGMQAGFGAPSQFMNQLGSNMAGAGQTTANAGSLYGQAGQLAGQGGQAYGQAGSVVEGYQNQALQDAMARFAYQYQEPYQRMQNVAQSLQFLQPLGVQSGTGAATQPNASYRSPWQTGLGLAGMVGGAFVGGPAGAMAGGQLGSAAGGMI